MNWTVYFKNSFKKAERVSRRFALLPCRSARFARPRLSLSRVRRQRERGNACACDKQEEAPLIINYGGCSGPVLFVLLSLSRSLALSLFSSFPISLLSLRTLGGLNKRVRKVDGAFSYTPSPKPPGRTPSLHGPVHAHPPCLQNPQLPPKPPLVRRGQPGGQHAPTRQSPPPPPARSIVP